MGLSSLLWRWLRNICFDLTPAVRHGSALAHRQAIRCSDFSALNRLVEIMRVKDEIRGVRRLFSDLTFYEKFEHGVILVLTLLIVAVVASATCHLALAVFALVIENQIDPANQAVFQAVFGMIFTVIIGLEFKHSLLIVLARQESIVRARSIVLIALLAVTRKFIILDLHEASSGQLFALSAAILVLGLVYWMVRDQDRRASAPGTQPATHAAN